MTEALSCIVCEGTLERALTNDGHDTQPYGGTSFDSFGHYGSTVFDPFLTGDRLHVNICDECLKAKAEKGLVLTNVAYLPIYADDMMVGRQWVHRETVPWKPELAYNEDRINVEPEEVGTDIGRLVEWNEQAKHFTKRLSQKKDS